MDGSKITGDVDDVVDVEIIVPCDIFGRFNDGIPKRADLEPPMRGVVCAVFGVSRALVRACGARWSDASRADNNTSNTNARTRATHWQRRTRVQMSRCTRQLCKRKLTR